MKFTDEPLEPFGETLLDISVPTQLSYKTPVVYRIIKELSSRGYLPWTGSPRAEICLDEALTNAMVHGNKLDPSRKVRVIVCADGERWGMIVEDEGAGFGPEQVPDPQAPDFPLRESGRGILLIDSYVDELAYTRRGNRLRLVRARQSEPEPGEALAAVEAEAVPPAESVDLVSVTDAGDFQIVRVNAARIGEGNVQQIREGIARALDENPCLVLDLGPVEYVSSVGLAVIVSAYKRVRERKGQLILANLQAGVREILQAAGLLKLFEVMPDTDAAAKEMRGRLR